MLTSDRELASVQASLQEGKGALYARLWGRREDLRLSDDPSAASGLLAPATEDDAIVAAGGTFGWRGAPAKGAKLEALVDASGERFVPGDFRGVTAPPGATRAAIRHRLRRELRRHEGRGGDDAGGERRVSMAGTTRPPATPRASSCDRRRMVVRRRLSGR